VDHAERRAARCRATCSATIRRPALAWCRRSPSSTCPRLKSADLDRGVDGRTRRGRRLRRPATLGRRRASSPSRNSPATGNMCSTKRIFTAPAHPNWGGTALIGPAGELLGIGLAAAAARRREGPDAEHQHDDSDRFVEADRRRPDEIRLAAMRPPRPCWAFMRPKWRTGLLSSGSPIADRLRKRICGPAIFILSVAGKDVRDLASFFRSIWTQGAAGVEVPISIYRDGETHGAAGEIERAQSVSQRAQVCIELSLPSEAKQSSSTAKSGLLRR